MKVRNLLLPSGILLAAGLLAGCASTTSSTDGGPMDSEGGTGYEMDDGTGTDGYTRGIGGGDGISGGAYDGDGDAAARGDRNATAPPAETVLYFDYDSSSVRAEYAEVLAEHSRYIMGRGVISVRLEGHADERGSREYNIGLGERRAQAVRQALLSLGVPAARLQTVSFGEERPVAFSHDEAAWSANRRVEIVYGTR